MKPNRQGRLYRERGKSLPIILPIYGTCTLRGHNGLRKDRRQAGNLGIQLLLKIVFQDDSVPGFARLKVFQGIINF